MTLPQLSPYINHRLVLQTHKEEQVSCSCQSITSIVARATDYQHLGGLSSSSLHRVATSHSLHTE